MTIGILSLWSCRKETSPKTMGIEHVVVIGVDGMSPDGILHAPTPVMDSLMAHGAATLHARAVMPSSSSPNWASMLMGADTEQHGITSNGWERNSYVLPPAVSTSAGTFPTIFNLFQDQRPETLVGAIYDWDGFGRLFEKNTVDFDLDGDGEDNTTELAVDYIKAHQPTFTFVHLDHVDHAGHAEGHGTPAYYAAVAKADSLIGKIVNATKAAGIFESTLFLVCADHGGVGKGHGGETMAEMEVPFILAGKGVKQGYAIEETVYQYDNAATIAFIFGLDRPQAWIGRPVAGAFEGYPKPTLRYTRPQLLEAPVLLPSQGPYAPPGGLFTGTEATITMENPNGSGTIYYTLDGSDPSPETGRPYENPVTVTQNTLVKAALFVEGKKSSAVQEGDYRILDRPEGHGVQFEVFKSSPLSVLPSFQKLQSLRKGTAPEFALDSIFKNGEPTEGTPVRMEAYLEVAKDGNYEFFTQSDDGSKLYVDQVLIVNNDGDHGITERSGRADLTKGKHLITVEYFNGGGGGSLTIFYKENGGPKRIVPANLLFTKP